VKQLTFMGVKRLRWLEVPEPRLERPEDVLVRPITVARCDLDRVWMTAPVGRALSVGLASHLCDPCACAVAGSPPYAPPIPVGHECVAEVSAVGSAVQRFRVGQRVVVPFQVACGACEPCQRGLSSRCLANPLPVNTFGFGLGARRYGGMLADLVRVPFADAMLVPLPDGVDPAAVASASDNLPDALRSVGPALRERPGGSVLVVGGSARSVGLYAVAFARALGASEVDYVDKNPERLRIAERLGARALEASPGFFGGAYRTLPRRYAVSVDACSDAAARGLELALRSLEPGGQCTSVGIYVRKRTPIPLMQMYVDGITLRTGITNARPLIPEVLRLVSTGQVDPSPVTTLLAPWDDAHEAFLDPTTKVVVSRLTSGNG
jgi:threonine dehydrogenase-like Zn-dependent dehydrogenase